MVLLSTKNQNSSARRRSYCLPPRMLGMLGGPNGLGFAFWGPCGFAPGCGVGCGPACCPACPAVDPNWLAGVPPAPVAFGFGICFTLAGSKMNSHSLYFERSL